MEMRDHFAVQIMQAFVKNTAALSKHSRFNFENAMECGINHGVEIYGAGANEDEEFTWAQYLAEEAYEVADAMIKARAANELRQQKIDAEWRATE
jgi:hypothetical protein